jgi:hypothetical protein
MSRTLGIDVRYEQISIPDFAEALTAEGYTPFLIQHLTSVAQDYRDGIFAGNNNLVEVITGTAALTVEQFTAANRIAFERPGNPRKQYH